MQNVGKLRERISTCCIIMAVGTKTNFNQINTYTSIVHTYKFFFFPNSIFTFCLGLSDRDIGLSHRKTSREYSTTRSRFGLERQSSLPFRSAYSATASSTENDLHIFIENETRKKKNSLLKLC